MRSPSGQRTWKRRVTTGVVTGSLCVLTAGSVRADNFITDTLLNLSPAEKEQLKNAGEVVGTISQIYGYVKTGMTIATWLGILPSPTADNGQFKAMMDNFQLIETQLAVIQIQIQAVATLQSQYWSNSLLAQSKTGYQVAQQWVSDNQKLLPQNGTFAQSSSDTLNAVNRIMVMDPNPYFHATFKESNTDGPVTTTLGVKTKAEWKLVNSARTKPSNGIVFEWRDGLPALLASVAARLGVLAITRSAADSSKSLLANSARWDQTYGSELWGYQDAIQRRMTEIESHVACSDAIWANVGSRDTLGDYTYKSLCTDTSSGITGKVEKRATITIPPNDPDWFGCSLDSFCFGNWWMNNHVPSLVNSIDNPWPLAYAFRQYAPKSPPFKDILAHGKEDALVNLYAGLGMYDAQRVVDRIENIYQGLSQPSMNGQIKNWWSRLCLDVSQGSIDAAAFFGVDGILGGMSFVMSDCQKPVKPWSSTWAWNEQTGQIVNIAYALYAGENWCLHAAGTRPGSPVLAEPCDGSPKQAWTWNFGSGVFTNKASMAPLKANGTAAGSAIVIGQPQLDNSSDASTMWGGI